VVISRYVDCESEWGNFWDYLIENWIDLVGLKALCVVCFTLALVIVSCRCMKKLCPLSVMK
jgi:hypothetical protein